MSLDRMATSDDESDHGASSGAPFNAANPQEIFTTETALAEPVAGYRIMTVKKLVSLFKEKGLPLAAKKRTKADMIEQLERYDAAQGIHNAHTTSHQYSGYTIAILRKLCLDRGLAGTGTKSMLQKRLEEADAADSATNLQKIPETEEKNEENASITPSSKASTKSTRSLLSGEYIIKWTPVNSKLVTVSEENIKQGSDGETLKSSNMETEDDEETISADSSDVPITPKRHDEHGIVIQQSLSPPLYSSSKESTDRVSDVYVPLKLEANHDSNKVVDGSEVESVDNDSPPSPVKAFDEKPKRSPFFLPDFQNPAKAFDEKPKRSPYFPLDSQDPAGVTTSTDPIHPTISTPKSPSMTGEDGHSVQSRKHSISSLDTEQVSTKRLLTHDLRNATVPTLRYRAPVAHMARTTQTIKSENIISQNSDMGSSTGSILSSPLTTKPILFPETASPVQYTDQRVQSISYAEEGSPGTINLPTTSHTPVYPWLRRNHEDQSPGTGLKPTSDVMEEDDVCEGQAMTERDHNLAAMAQFGNDGSNEYDPARPYLGLPAALYHSSRGDNSKEYDPTSPSYDLELE